MASKFQFITELYSRTLTRLTGDYESWTGFLRSACYNYKCPFDEQVLIYAQRPDATAVLELEKWNRRFGRWVNAGATRLRIIVSTFEKGFRQKLLSVSTFEKTTSAKMFLMSTFEKANQK